MNCSKFKNESRQFTIDNELHIWFPMIFSITHPLFLSKRLKSHHTSKKSVSYSTYQHTSKSAAQLTAASTRQERAAAAGNISRTESCSRQNKSRAQLAADWRRRRRRRLWRQTFRLDVVEPRHRAAGRHIGLAWVWGEVGARHDLANATAVWRCLTCPPDRQCGPKNRQRGDTTRNRHADEPDAEKINTTTGKLESMEKIVA